MFASDARDDSNLRLHHPNERRQFAGMIRAEFKNRSFVPSFQLEQRLGHANVVVETGFAPERREFLPQH